VADGNWAAFRQLAKFVREAQLDQARDYIKYCFSHEHLYTQISVPVAIVEEAANGNSGQSSS